MLIKYLSKNDMAERRQKALDEFNRAYFPAVKDALSIKQFDSAEEIGHPFGAVELGCVCIIGRIKER